MRVVRIADIAEVIAIAVRLIGICGLRPVVTGVEQAVAVLVVIRSERARITAVIDPITVAIDPGLRTVCTHGSHASPTPS